MRSTARTSRAAGRATRLSTRPSADAGGNSAPRPAVTGRATWRSMSRPCARRSATTASTITRSPTARYPSRPTRPASRSTSTHSCSTPGWFLTTALSRMPGVSVFRRRWCGRTPPLPARPACHGDVAAAIRSLAARVRAHPVEGPYRGRRGRADQPAPPRRRRGEYGAAANRPSDRRPPCAMTTPGRCSPWRSSSQSGPARQAPPASTPKATTSPPPATTCPPPGTPTDPIEYG